MSEEKRNVTYQIVRGFQCPISERFTAKNMEDAMDFIPGDGDLIIASYPKTGTTWMQYILLQIRSKGEYFPSFDDVTIKVAPFMEMAGIAAVLAQDEPRFYKHHLPYNAVKKNEKAKVVYTYRHPEDTVVSFYHFILNMEPNRPLDFNEFFECFVNGKISYGSYFQHVLSFYEQREDNNLLMVSYEKLHSNRKAEILRIAKFLGDEYYQSLLADEEILNKIIYHTTFDYMKKNLFLTLPHLLNKNEEQLKEKPAFNFFRKGIVGDGKAALTNEQRQILKEAAEKILKGTSILEEWYGN